MYVLHVRTGKELDIKTELARLGYDAYVPAERSVERHGGVWRDRERIVMPGYVFIRLDLTEADYYRIRAVPNVLRFLGNAAPEALRDGEAEYIGWLANDGDPLGPSEILLEGGRVAVMAGPLRGHEGQIIRVNRRQRRVTLTVTFAENRREFNLSANFIKQVGGDHDGTGN